MGQPLEAHIRELQEVYWSDSDPDGRCFVPLADALRRAGDFREARRVLREGLGRHPDFLSGHVVAGWLSMDRGDDDEAEARFRTALDLDPKNIAALRGMAEILSDRGKFASALAYFEVLLLEDPLDPKLPDRVLEVRARAEAEFEYQPETQDGDSRSLLWDDPDRVADEMDWEGAALQSDSSPESQSHTDGVSSPTMPVVEDGEPIPDLDHLDEAVTTQTLGEVFLRQGHYRRAEEVFESLSLADPGNQHLQHRLEEVRQLLEAEGAGEREGSGLRGEEVVPIESLAPDVSTGSPDDGIPGAGEEKLAAPLIMDIEALAPDRPAGRQIVDEVVSVEDLAPDEPAILTIDALAPDEPAVLSIDALAPDEPAILSIDALAPDEPAILSIDALAPDPTEDSTIEDFEHWLDNLQ